MKTKQQQSAEKLRALADAMQSTIEGKLHSATSQQNPTRRRNDIAASMRQDGYKLQLVQACLRGLANAFDTTPVGCRIELTRIATKSQVEALLTGCRYPDFKPGCFPTNDAVKATTLIKIGIVPDKFLDCQQELLNLRSFDKEKHAKLLAKAKIKELEATLLGRKIPGFFPTPIAVIKRMWEQLINTPDFDRKKRQFLEPSAGKGDIADFLKSKGVNVECLEVNYDLRKVLTAKGHNVIGEDFIREPFGLKKYDYILMNPPWGREVDGHIGEHIRKAYDLLAPGGAMVSLCDAGVFFRGFKLDVEFRHWLISVGAESEPLPEQSFKNGFVSTGVRVEMITIVKSEIAAEYFEDKPSIEDKQQTLTELLAECKRLSDSIVI